MTVEIYVEKMYNCHCDVNITVSIKNINQMIPTAFLTILCIYYTLILSQDTFTLGHCRTVVYLHNMKYIQFCLLFGDILVKQANSQNEEFRC